MKDQQRGLKDFSLDDLPERHKAHVIILVLVLIAFVGIVLYSNILNAPFILDDYSAIVDNEAVKNISPSLGNISSNRYLTSFSFAFNYAAFGLKPFTYHFINNIIHVINALLVYYLVILTFRTPYFSYQPSAISHQQSSHSPIHQFTYSPSFVAFSTAFIFVSHPIQTQAVTYIAQRATSMAAMFYLLSVVMYIKWRLRMQDTGYKTQDITPLNPPLPRGDVKGGIMHRASWIMYLCSIISAILAMKTKEIAFTLPLVIALYEFSFFNKATDYKVSLSNLKRFLYLLPILLTLLIIPLGMVNFKAPVEVITQDINAYSRETVNITRIDYLLTQFRVIVTYLRLLVLPVNQSLDYSYSVYRSFLDAEVFLSFLFLILLLGIGVYLYYRSRLKKVYRNEATMSYQRLISFGIFWFFITLSVESSIIPIKDVIVEHRLYLPSIGFFIASLSFVEYFVRWQKVKVVAIVIIVAVLSVTTFNRNLLWNDPQALWEDVLIKFPNNVRAHNGLGVIFKEQEEYDKALIQLEKALKINPIYFPAYYNIGDIQYKVGNYGVAVEYFEKVLRLKPSYHFHLDTLNSLAITYSEMDDDRNAVGTFNDAIRLFPSSIMLYNNLGRQYIKMGNFDSAIEILKKGLEIREAPHLRSNLYIAYAAKKQRNKNAE